MKIVCMSDLHGNLIKDVPSGDTLVITGDICPVTNHEVYYQKKWIYNDFIPYLESLKHPNKIFIFGNHDFCGQLKQFVAKTHSDCESKGITLLHDSEAVIDGLKFYGTPFTPWFYNWAFNLYEEQLRKVYDKIPKDTNVLLTHGPPKYVLDLNCAGGEHCGSACLLDIIQHDLKELKLSVFGHIHEPYGIVLGTPIYVNASILNDEYIVKNPPIVVEI